MRRVSRINASFIGFLTVNGMSNIRLDGGFTQAGGWHVTYPSQLTVLVTQIDSDIPAPLVMTF